MGKLVNDSCDSESDLFFSFFQSSETSSGLSPESTHKRRRSLRNINAAPPISLPRIKESSGKCGFPTQSNGKISVKLADVKYKPITKPKVIIKSNLALRRRKTTFDIASPIVSGPSQYLRLRRSSMKYANPSATSTPESNLRFSEAPRRLEENLAVAILMSPVGESRFEQTVRLKSTCHTNIWRKRQSNSSSFDDASEEKIRFKPYCPVCQKQYSSYNSIAIHHNSVHLKIRSHYPYCKDKSFSNQACLFKHLREGKC